MTLPPLEEPDVEDDEPQPPSAIASEQAAATSAIAFFFIVFFSCVCCRSGEQPQQTTRPGFRPNLVAERIHSYPLNGQDAIPVRRHRDTCGSAFRMPVEREA